MDEPQIPHFMPGGAGGVMKMSEEEQNDQSLKVTTHIAGLDDELKGRFQALYVLQETCKDFDEEEQKEIRKLEVEYEKKYKTIYAERERIINAKDQLPAEMISAFDVRAVEMKDADYDKLEINPCDVKSIMNGKGVSDFWIKAILSHGIGATVTEKDRPVLGNLVNIELNLHEETLGKGYDLYFTFDNNSYFTTVNHRNTDKTTTITKSITMKQEGMPDEIRSTLIDWQPKADPTKKMKQKKKKGKKVKVEVQCDSFFNFFRTIDPLDEETIKKAQDDKPPKEDDEDEGFEDGGVDQQMQDDLDESDQFKDDLVPLALEYYLGVIEQPDPEDEDDDEGDDGSDGDDAPKPKKGKKGGAGAGAAAGLADGAAEGQDKDCKQQ